MKTKNFITIIRPCIGALLGLFIPLTGCESNQNSEPRTGELVIIDSCEYVLCTPGIRGSKSYVHHASCEHCTKHAEEERTKFAGEVADRLIEVLYEE